MDLCRLSNQGLQSESQIHLWFRAKAVLHASVPVLSFSPPNLTLGRFDGQKAIGGRLTTTGGVKGLCSESLPLARCYWRSRTSGRRKHARN